MNVKLLLLSGVVLPVAAVAIWAGMELASAPPAKTAGRAPRTVKLFRVASGREAGTVVYPGRIEAKEHAGLFFRVAGPVIENALELGMAVKRGELMMRIDPRDYEREIDRLTHELEVMRARHGYLQLEYERMDSLMRNNATSRTLFESALSARDASVAEIRGKETALRIARDKLADTRLVAPFSGRVIRLGIEKFEMARANEVVVSLQNLEQLDVVVNIPEGNIPELAGLGQGGLHGKNFPIRFPGRDVLLSATLTEFNPVAAPENGTYELRLTMKQPEHFTVLPGMTVEVLGLPMRAADGGAVPRIPFSAVFRRHGQNCVWLYDPQTGKTTEQSIRIGAIFGEFMEAPSLKEGALIVAAGGSWLDEAAPVRVMNPEVLHEVR